MDSKQLKTYGLGSLLANGILFIEMFNDLRTGKYTWVELITVILFCLFTAALVLKFVRLQRAKERKPQKPMNTIEENSTDSAEESAGNEGTS